MTAWGSKLTFVPLLGECEQWGPLRDARVGVWRTLPLLDDSVRRAAFDVYNSGVPVTGDRKVGKLIFGPPKKWRLAPGN
mgnify:CR=1 FL=1